MTSKFPLTEIHGPSPGDVSITVCEKEKCIHREGHQFGKVDWTGWAHCACGAMKMTRFWNGTNWGAEP